MGGDHIFCVGAAEGCDLLILKINSKRSQPAAAPTAIGVVF
jgi:hypothetical protein